MVGRVIDMHEAVMQGTLEWTKQRFGDRPEASEIVHLVLRMSTGWEDLVVEMLGVPRERFQEILRKHTQGE